MDPSLLKKFKELICRYSGIKIQDRDDKKLSLAISLRMNNLDFSNILTYYQNLNLNNKTSYEETLKLICTLTNKETYFFRNHRLFDCLKQKILPDLIKRKNAQKVLRIWSAGCSTGEEPYSIAILLFSLLPNWKSWNILILGTDLSENLLEQARLGIYKERAFRSMDIKDREKYFLKQLDGSWLIAPFLQQAVTFQQGNLLFDPFPDQHTLLHSMDLIVCQNVFIYFEGSAIQKVVDKYAQTLNQEGYLLTGLGELQGIIPPMKKQILQGTIAYQK